MYETIWNQCYGIWGWGGGWYRWMPLRATSDVIVPQPDTQPPVCLITGELNCQVCQGRISCHIWENSVKWRILICKIVLYFATFETMLKNFRLFRTVPHIHVINVCILYTMLFFNILYANGREWEVDEPLFYLWEPTTPLTPRPNNHRSMINLNL